MTMDEALRDLGVGEDTLSEAEKNFLDENGYLPLPDVFTEHLNAFRTLLMAIAETEGENAGWELREEGRTRIKNDVGATRLSNLVDKDPRFSFCFTQPRVLAAIAHVLQQPFKLSSLNGRFALPGQGLQPMHVDWPGPVAPGDFHVCNSIWLMDDFTGQNGATRVVPGSHRNGKIPADDMPDPMAPHPDEIPLLGKAGTVVIFNSHTWHGGTRNHTDAPRRAVHAYYCRRDQKQQTDQKRFLRPETVARLSDAERYILDV